MPPIVGFFGGLFGIQAAAGIAGYSLGAAIASTTIGSVVAKLLTSVALSALSAALMPKPRPSIGSIRTNQTLNGGINPETFFLGRYATGGALIAPPMSHGYFGKVPNAYLTYVIELAGTPGHTLEALYIDGEPAPILTENPHPDYGFRIGGRFEQQSTSYAWIKFYDGTQTQADPMLLAKYGPPYVRPWSADMIGTGICYAILTFRFNRQIFQSLPTPRFVMKAPPQIDPRQSSPVVTDNAVAHIYNVLRGIALPSGEVWGGEIDEADLPPAIWEQALDAADALVDNGDGGTEPAFRAGFEVRVDDEPFSVIEELLLASNAALAESGGVWSIRVGGPGLPVAFLTDADIIVDAPEDYAPFPPLDQIYNAITASYPNPEAIWEPAEAPIRTNAAWEAEDGGRRLTASVSLPAVPYPAQVQRITAALIASHRRMRRHVLTLPPTFLGIEALDVISWTSEANGYESKLFEVVEATRDIRTQLVRVSLREVDPSDYAVPSGLTLPTPVSPAIPVRPAQPVPLFSVQPYTLTIDGQPRRGGVLATWDASGADDARGVQIAIRRAGDTDDGRPWPLQPVAAGAAVLVDGLVPGNYEVRAILVVDRPVEWTAWLPVTVPDVRLSLDDFNDELNTWISDLGDWINAGVDLPGDLNDLAQDIAAEAQARADALAAEAQERLNSAIQAADRWREMRDRIDDLTAEILEVIGQAEAVRAELRTSIGVQVDDARAQFDQRIATVVTDLTAAVQRVTTLEAETDDLDASITALESALVTELEALALLVTQISVGTATAFDTAVRADGGPALWFFDSTVEGWTGTTDPPTVAVTGWLRPASGSGVVSPTGLDIATASYPEVRARLRRIGAPTWTGQLWWAASDEDWDALRRVTAAEPVWAPDGTAVVSWNPGWSGTLDRILVDLASGTDGSNYIEIDWIGIGRATPSASRADVTSERAARINADNTLAAAIDTVEAQVNDPATGLNALGTAIQTQQAQINQLGDDLAVEAGRIDQVEAQVGDPATGNAALALAIDALEVLVEQNADSQVVGAAATRALRSVFEAFEAEALETLGGNLERQRAVREYIAEASQTLNTRIDVTDSQVAILAEALTLLQATIPGLATTTALQALIARVTQNEAGISAQATALTELTAATDPNNPATARFRMQALSGPTGFARLGMQVRSGGTADWNEAAIYLDAPNNPALPARIVLQADQTVFATPSGTTAPFTVSGSELRVAVPMESPVLIDGQPAFRIDPTTGVAEFETVIARRRNIARGSISSAFLLQEALDFSGDTPDGVWTDMGSLSFTLPSFLEDLPDRIIITPEVGGKTPGSAIAQGYGPKSAQIAYRFRVRGQRNNTTTFISAWGLAPFWQCSFYNSALIHVFYAGTPSTITFWIEPDESGPQPSDTLIIDFQYLRNRTDPSLIEPFHVASETLEARVEYFFR